MTIMKFRVTICSRCGAITTGRSTCPQCGAPQRCCDEYNCKRKHPIGIYRGDFTGQVYAAMSMRLVKDHGDGTATFSATVKHDVTRQMRRFIRANAEWVREVLDAEGK